MSDTIEAIEQVMSLSDYINKVGKIHLIQESKLKQLSRAV